MGGPTGSTTDDEIELRAAIEDMWILAIHPPPPSPPTADLLRIVGRDDLCDQVSAFSVKCYPFAHQSSRRFQISQTKTNLMLYALGCGAAADATTTR